MNVLITGGAGFIGSHLAEKYLSAGRGVAVLDDLSTGSTDNLAAVKSHSALEFHADTIFNEPLLKRMIGRADAVIHLAASVGVRLIVTDPVRTIETNIHGTELVLKYAAEQGKRVILASSSEVYGKSNKIPFREDDDLILGPTTKGRWSYACSKAVDEFLGLAYHKEKKLPVTILRFFNTVGPRQTGRYGMVIPRFVESALAGRPLEVYGDGAQSRCFSNVADVVDAVVRVADEPGTVGQVYNVGSTQEISIADLARRVIQITGSRSEVKFVPYEQAMEQGFEDMRRRVPDVSKLEKAVGWRPHLSLDDTLRQVVSHFSGRP